MAEELKVTPNTALENLIDAEYAAEEPKETPAEEQPDEEVTDSLDEDPQEESPEVEEPVTDVMFLNDFAKDVEVDVADVYELSVKMPDEMEPTTISELKNFKIANADIDQVKLELKNRETELQAQADSMRDVPQVSNELMQARAKVLSIQDQYNRVNWEHLRQHEKQEWSVLQQEFRNQFEGAKAEEAEATNKVDEQKAQARQFQHDRLLESMPELKDDTVRTDAWNKVSKLASRYGYSQSEIAQIEDSRLMRLLIDASKKDITVKEVQKKLDTTPPKKGGKPVARRTATTRKPALKRLKDKAASTGSKKDINAFIDAALS